MLRNIFSLLWHLLLTKYNYGKSNQGQVACMRKKSKFTKILFEGPECKVYM